MNQSVRIRRQSRWIVCGLGGFSLLLWSSLALCRTLSLTFDDGLNPGTQPNAEILNAQMLSALRSAGVISMVFPTLKSAGSERGLELIKAWSAAGHAVGNHTATHRSLAAPEVSLADFISDVSAADAVLRQLPTWVPMLRFPYLKEGDTLEKRDGMRAWMRSHGYRPACVSIDASDWYYSEVYSAQLKSGSRAKAAAIKRAYIEHLLDRAEYYDSLARQVLGRSPSHVMLLHTNEINAASLGELVTALRARGWTIVPPSAAFDDPLYASAPDILPAGESIVWAMARERGIQGLRYPAEDSIYEEPKLRARGLVP